MTQTNEDDRGRIEQQLYKYPLLPGAPYMAAFGAGGLAMYVGERFAVALMVLYIVLAVGATIGYEIALND